MHRLVSGRSFLRAVTGRTVIVHRMAGSIAKVIIRLCVRSGLWRHVKGNHKRSGPEIAT